MSAGADNDGDDVGSVDGSGAGRGTAIDPDVSDDDDDFNPARASSTSGLIDAVDPDVIDEGSDDGDTGGNDDVEVDDDDGDENDGRDTAPEPSAVIAGNEPEVTTGMVPVVVARLRPPRASWTEAFTGGGGAAMIDGTVGTASDARCTTKPVRPRPGGPGTTAIVDDVVDDGRRGTSVSRDGGRVNDGFDSVGDTDGVIDDVIDDDAGGGGGGDGDGDTGSGDNASRGSGIGAMTGGATTGAMTGGRAGRRSRVGPSSISSEAALREVITRRRTVAGSSSSSSLSAPSALSAYGATGSVRFTSVRSSRSMTSSLGSLKGFLSPVLDTRPA